MKTSLQEELATAHQKLDAIEETARHLFTNGLAIKKLHADAAASILIRLQIASSGTPVNGANASIYVIPEVRAAVLISTLSATVTALDESPEFAAALKLIHPIVNRISEIEAQIAADAVSLNVAHNSLLAAEEAALEKARAAAALDPAVIKAAAALAGLSERAQDGEDPR